MVGNIKADFVGNEEGDQEERSRGRVGRGLKESK